MFELQPIKQEINIKGFHSIYYFEFDNKFTHTPEKHDFWELVYVDSGKIIAITDGNSCIINEGQIIFQKPNEVHAHISSEDSHNNMLVISFSCDSPCMNFFTKKTFNASKTVKKIFSLFINEAKNSLGEIPHEYENKKNLDFSKEKFGSTQLLSCYLTELLISLIRENVSYNNKIISTEESRALAKNSICELICDYMQENIYNNLSLDDICKKFLLGKSHISYIFKINNDSTIMEYYNGLKIKEAKKLLRDNNLSISQIADALGYSCIHSFSRAFKNSVGISPKEYSKRHTSM